MKKPEKNVGLHQRNAVLSKRVGQMLAGSLLAFVSFGASASESDDREALMKTLRQVHANYQAADEAA